MTQRAELIGQIVLKAEFFAWSYCEKSSKISKRVTGNLSRFLADISLIKTRA
jgi:hypothetical protein